MSDPAPAEPLWLHLLRSFFLAGLGLAVFVAGLEVWERRWAWPVDPSWYALEETSTQVSFRCQRFAPVVFSPQPAAGVTRILALGGSTTFGFPERMLGEAPVDGQRFGVLGVVQASLDRAWAGRFEVVNLGVAGGMSDDTLRLTRRALDWGVGAVLVYDGHNEFMNVPAQFSPSLWQFALYRHLLLLAPRITVSPGAVGPAVYGGPAQHAAVEAHFAENLDTLAALVRGAGLPLVLVTQASNLDAFDPAWSFTGDPTVLSSLSARRDAEVEALWRADRDVADLAWAAGRRPGVADRREALLDAVDADAMPIRASRVVNTTIREVAARHGATLVDGEAAVGDAPFYDNVHPEAEAALRLGGAMLDGLHRAAVLPGAVEAVAPVRSVDERVSAERRTAGYWLRQACVRVHDPAFRIARATEHAEAALALVPGDPEATTLLALARALPTHTPVPVADEALRAHLAAIHPDVAALVGLP